MRLLLASAALVLLTAPGCQRLDPAAYRAALRHLSVRLVSLTPRLELAIPLDRSALNLEVTLEVDNPTDLPLHVRAVQAQLWLDQGRALPITRLAFPHGVHLPPRAKNRVTTSLRLSPAELREAWTPLRRVLLERGQATWRMEGSARIEVMGLPLDLPFSVTREQGSPR